MILKKIFLPLVGLGSSVLAFLGVLSCCGFPLLAGVLAWFGIGTSHLHFFSEYRVFFLILALVAIVAGFYQVYFKKSKNESCCTKSSSSKFASKLFLWLGVVAIIYSIFSKVETTTIKNNEQQMNVNRCGCK
jgi:formate hydrogenlyase subunit 3/multisubunit Na+/H+ antiporter MnhD subunit